MGGNGENVKVMKCLIVSASLAWVKIKNVT